ncbi:MAG TPA: zinc ribbon domain-containing protein [Anaerolineaceae bacterium]|nr:zinc ribbon domain-containing protein [Anaerolineaceae bacterium]HPN52195.1 zinc ribbon domain-containing protein [Anaerolineaceae bacterium]
MPIANLCPQCGAPVYSGAEHCSYCGVPFVRSAGAAKFDKAAKAAGSSAPAPTPTSLPPVPPDWMRYADPWNGVALAHPPGWRVITTQGTVSVRRDSAGLTQASIQPIHLQNALTEQQLASQWIATVRRFFPDFTAWEVPGTAKTGRLTLRVQAHVLGVPLAGSFMIDVQGQNAVISGFHAPAQAVESLTHTFETLLSSFRPVERMPRQMHREMGEGAFALWAPAGWQVQTGLNRNTPGGNALVQANITRDPSSLVQACIAWMTWSFMDGGGFWGMPPGQMRPYKPAAQLCEKDVAEWMAQRHQNFHVEEILDRPDLLPMIHFELAKAGLDPQHFDCSAANILTSYTEGGQRIRQSTRIMVQRPHMGPSFTAMITGGGGPWYVYLDTFYRAPEAEFPALEPILSGILDSLQMNPAWQQNENRRNQAVIMRQQQDTFRRQQQISHTLSQTSDIITQGYEQRSGVYDRLSHDWSNAILGYQDMTDGSGTVYNVPTGYDQYWRDGLDNIYGGGWLVDPDPGWTRLDPTS